MLQRDFEHLIRLKGFDRAIREAMFQQIEEVEDLRKTVKEMAQVISSMSDVLVALNVVADGMKLKLDRLDIKEDDGRSTHSVLKGD